MREKTAKKKTSVSSPIIAHNLNPLSTRRRRIAGFASVRTAVISRHPPTARLVGLPVKFVLVPMTGPGRFACGRCAGSSAGTVEQVKRPEWFRHTCDDSTGFIKGEPMESVGKCYKAREFVRATTGKKK